MAAILTRDKEAVFGNFVHHGRPMWAIYEGSKPLDCCCEEDEQDRENRLKQYLTFMFESGSTAPFEIRYYEECGKNKKVNNNSPFFASLPFKVNSPETALENLTAKTGGGGGSMAQMMPLMMQLFEAKIENQNVRWEHMLEKKEQEIQALEDQLNEEPEYEDKAMGKIGGIVNMLGAAGEKHTWLQDPIKKLANAFSNLANGLHVQHVARNEQPVHFAGVPPQPQTESMEDKLKWANQTILLAYRRKHGVKMNEQGQVLPDTNGTKTNENLMNQADAEYVEDMVKVAKVASTKPNTWDTAIKSLREMV